MAAPEKFTYRAFLSYSHADRAWGEAFHKALESYRVPGDLAGRDGLHGKIPAKLRPVFRDRFDLEAGHSLDEQILDALGRSEALIVACSPASASSAYVNEEIRRFKMSGRGHRILPIIVTGKPGDPNLNPFPPMLSAVLDDDGQPTGKTVEPLAADARPEGDGLDLALQKIAAGLMGVDLDDLRQRERRDERRRRRFWISMAAGGIILACVATVAAYLAHERRKQFEHMLARTMVNAGQLVRTTVQASRERGVPVGESVRFLGQASKMLEDVERGAGNKSGDVRYERAAMHMSFADSFLRLQRLDPMKRHADAALGIMEGLVEEEPDNPRWRFGLSEALIRVGRDREARGDNESALAQYRRSLLIKKELVKPEAEEEEREWQAGLAGLHERIAQTFQRRGELEGVREHIEAWLQISRRLADRYDDSTALDGLAFAHVKLSDLQRQRAQIGDARQTVAEGLLVVDRIRTKTDSIALARRHGASLRVIMGDIHTRAGDREKALASYREAFELTKQLTIQDPSNVGWQNSHAFSFVKIAETLNGLGRRKEALDVFIEGKEIQERLVVQHPDSVDIQRRLQDSLQGIADIQMQLRNFSEARAAAERRLAVAKDVLKLDTESEQAEQRVAASHRDLGEVLVKMDRAGEAKTHLGKAMDMYADLSVKAPNNVSRKRNAATSKELLARTEMALGNRATALELVNKAHAIRAKLVEEDRSLGYRKRDLAMNLALRASLYEPSAECEAGLADYEEAVRLISRALEIVPKQREWKYNSDDISRASRRLAARCRPPPAAADPSAPAAGDAAPGTAAGGVETSPPAEVRGTPDPTDGDIPSADSAQ